MKLNFWQWLGVILLIVGIVVYVWEKRRATTATPGTTPATQSP